MNNYKKNKILCLICARSGSKGVKNKNIKKFHGKPLIYWTIKQAKSLPEIKDVFISTDSKKIVNVAKKYGAKVPFLRPKKLAKDNSKEWDVWKHAINFFESKKKYFETILVLPVTSPLRNKNDIRNCINKFKKQKKKVDAIVTITDSSRNPYFNIVSENNGFINLVKGSNKKYFTRGTAPKVYDLCTVAYLVKTRLIKTKRHLFDGKIKSVYIPKERSVDIDTPIDFKFAEFLKKNANL